MSTFMLRPASFTAEEAAAAFARAKKSRNGNPVSVSKIFYYESYRRMLEKATAIAVLQNNNLAASDYALVKQKMKARGFAVTHVRNGVLGAAARDHFFAKVGGKKENYKDVDKDGEIGTAVRRFKRMLVGPSFVVFSDASAEERPFLVRDLSNALTADALTAPVFRKILIGGAVVEGRHILSRTQLEEASKLPSVADQRSALVGLLSAPGSRLVGALSQHPAALVRTLSGRAEAGAAGAAGAAAEGEGAAKE